MPRLIAPGRDRWDIEIAAHVLAVGLLVAAFGFYVVERLKTRDAA